MTGDNILVIFRGTYWGVPGKTGRAINFNPKN